MRADLGAALAAAHPAVQPQLRGDCRSAVELLDQHLSGSERVSHIISIAPRNEARVNSVLAITDRRVVFVAPAPQAIALPLTAITKFQISMGYCWFEGAGMKYSLGSDGIDRSAADQFEAAVKHAMAVAVLADL